MRLRAVAILLTASALASCTYTERPDEPSRTPDATSAPRARRPSQSPEDAARDGVPGELAALPFGRRVQAEVTVSSDNEVWVASRPRVEIASDTVEYAEYGEILLLDKRRPRRILRAYPFQGVPPQRLALIDEALYCGRAGDGGLPDSMVCRIDRDTLDIVVRVYPHDADAPWVADYPQAWTIADGHLEMDKLEVSDDGVWSRASDGSWTRLDPSTLRIVDRIVARP